MISNAWPQALSAVSVCNHKKDLGFFQIYMQDLLIKLALATIGNPFSVLALPSLSVCTLPNPFPAF